MRPSIRTGLLLGALATALLASAIGTVYAKHQSRRLFMELSALIDERDRLEVDWSRLQMEQSTWSTHARVDQLARDQMHMRNPAPQEVELLTP